jgi:translocation and assembly module TamB
VRLAVQILLIAVLVAVVVLVMGPVRTELSNRLDAVRRQAVDNLQDLLGREVTYGSISPSILRYLSIKDLTIHGRADEPADLLHVEDLRIYYRPLRILQQRYDEAFSEVRVENSTLTLDTRFDTDLSSLMADLLGSRSEESSFLPANLVVRGRNLTLAVTSELGTIEMERVFFDTTLSEAIVSIRSQGQVVVTDLPAAFPVSTLTGQIEANGTINVMNGSTLLEVAFPEVDTDVATLRRQVVQIRYADGSLEARNVQSRDPVDLYIRYATETEEIYARILADGYRVADLVTLKNSLEPYNVYLQMPLYGQASATVSESGVSYTGSIRTSLHNLPVPDGELTATFDGNQRALTVSGLSYRSEIGGLEYSGVIALDPFRPTGTISVENFRYGDYPLLTATAQVTSRENAVTITTGPFTYAGVPISSISGTAQIGSEASSEFRVVMGRGEGRRLDVRTEHNEGGALRYAHVDARAVDPQELITLQEALLPEWEVPDLSFLPDSVIADARVLLDLSNGVEIDVPLCYLYDSTNEEDHLSFALSYDNGEVRISNITAGYAGYEGFGDMQATISQDGVIEFASAVEIEDIPYEFSGVFDPGGSLFISGLYDVNARLYFGERGELVFDASGDVPIPSSVGNDARVSFSGDGYYFSPEDWTASFSRLTASGIAFATVPNATIDIVGTFFPEGARLNRVRFADGISTVSGDGSINWTLPAMNGRIALELANEEIGERYSLEVAYQDGHLNGAAMAERLPLARLGVEAVTGSVTGEFAVAGPPSDLTLDLDAMLVDGRFNNDPVELETRLTLAPDRINVEYARGRYVRTRAENISASLSVEEGRLALSGDLIQAGDTGGFDVGVVGSADFGEMSSITDLLSQDFSGRLALSRLPVKPGIPGDWEFDVSRTHGVINGLGGPESSVSFRIEPTLEFTAATREPLPLEFNAIGRLDGGDLELDLVNVHADVPRLWRFVDSPGFLFTQGVATGSVRVFGPLNDPDFFGTLIAENLVGTVDLIPDQLGPIRTYLVFDEKILTARQAVAPVGEGQARVSAAVTLDRWLPEEFAVWVETLPDLPVHVVNDFGGVAVDGSAGGALTITGDLSTTNIAGSLTASQMDILVAEEQAEGDSDDDPGDLRVDVTVTSGRGIEFLWPSTAWPILRGFADVGEEVAISYRSATGSHHVQGRVDIQGGEVFYFDRSFYIQDGRMTFDEDETGFDPLLTIDAEIREVAEEGPVRIYLEADEAPLSEFTPRWRSDPPLSEATIIAMLGGSVLVTDEGTPLDVQQAVLLGSNLVSQFAIIRGFETTVREALQLDLFSIRTQLFQNIIRDAIGDGTYPLDTSVPSLGKYLDNTTLFMGKYLGTDLFLELLVQVSAADPESVTSRSLAGVEVDPEISLEWQTPFFQLEWAFFPTDPETLFLTDNTFRFFWEYSY